MRWGRSSERAGLSAPARARGAGVRDPRSPVVPWKARGVARIICAASSGAGRGVRAEPAGKLRQEGLRAPWCMPASRSPRPLHPAKGVCRGPLLVPLAWEAARAGRSKRGNGPRLQWGPPATRAPHYRARGPGPPEGGHSQGGCSLGPGCGRTRHRDRWGRGWSRRAAPGARGVLEQPLCLSFPSLRQWGPRERRPGAGASPRLASRLRCTRVGQ